MPPKLRACQQYKGALTVDFITLFEQKEPWVSRDPSSQIQDLLSWKKHGLPFSVEDLHRAHNDCPDVALTTTGALVAVAYLATLEDTFNFYVEVLKEVHPKFSLFERIKSDPSRLRLKKNAGIFPANTIRWELVDLATLWDGTAPDSTQEDIGLAHFAIPALLAHNPAFAAQMNSPERPNLWVPGLEVKMEGTWSETPACCWDNTNRELCVVSFPSNMGSNSMAIPILIEVWPKSNQRPDLS